MSTSKPRIFSITVNNRKLFHKVYMPASSLQALIISWCHLTFKILPIQWVCKDISLNPFKHMYICLFVGCVGSSLLLAAFSLVVASRGYSLVTPYRLLLAVASLVAEHRLRSMDSVSCGTQAELSRTCGTFSDGRSDLCPQHLNHWTTREVFSLGLNLYFFD